jgi:broad-specificity NMP kinase
MTQRDRACATGSVPVLLITGPVGVGKSTVGREVFRLLGEEARVRCAFVDLPALGAAWPPPSDDPWNERLLHANLACTWEKFKRNGARRLVLCRVLEARSLLRHIRAAVPGAEIVVVGLRAPLELIHERVRSREAADPSWYLDAATELVEKLRSAGVEDHTVDNDHRSPTDVASEILRIIGWLAD